MKKITLLLIFCLFATTMVNAQRREVRQANRNLNRGNIDVALQHIQNAITDESTKADPETWVLKTQILMEVSVSEDPAIQALVEDPLVRAYESIKQAKKLDVENQNILEIQQTLLVLSEFFFNFGAQYYNENKFDRASTYFLTSYQVAESFGSIDTATLYNAGLAAEIAGNFDKAIEIYKDVDKYEYDQPYLYSSMGNIFNQRGEIEEAEKWITKGRERYPENLDLIFTEANIYLTSGNIPEAKRILEIAIERDPDNANLHYAFAVNYDQMSRDTLYSAEERKFAYEESIKAYEKAIEINPEYFDAIYNLGALYFNEGINFFLEADNILRQGYSNENLRKAQKLEEQSKKIWQEDAQPYLERAKELLEIDNENYEIVLRSLRELYMRTGQEQKLEAANEIWFEHFATPEEEE